jgi:chemotaxis protein histidine kinase CheA
MAPVDGDAFEKELLELFAQEAQEWIQQIAAAVTELHTPLSRDQRVSPCEAITRCLTNLGGSAATINLPEVERAAFALLPFVDLFRKSSGADVTADLEAIRNNLTHLVASLRQATNTSFELPTWPAGGDRVDSETSWELFVTKLAALRERQDASSQDTRHSANHLLLHLDEARRRRGAAPTVEDIRLWLQERDTEDAALLRAVEEHFPVVSARVAKLKHAGEVRSAVNESWGPTLDKVSKLTIAAQRVSAVPIQTFLSGLQSFLLIISQKRLMVAAQRVEAVEARIQAVATMAYRWVEAGKAERAAIGNLLPT